MGKVRVASFSISIDGYGAGPRQDLQNPLGVRGMELHQWVFPTDFFQRMHGGQPGGEFGRDNDLATEAMTGIGAWILGRNMFGPERGPWPDENWQGWWGDTPPYHVPVIVLTHHPRPPLAMAGGTTFYFVSDPHEALERARAAGGDLDVRIGGGVATILHYLQVGAIDEMRLAISPVVLGTGEHLSTGLDLSQLGFTVTRTVHGEKATHVVLSRTSLGT